MKARIQRITFDRRGRLASAVFRCRESGLRQSVTVRVIWKDVSGDWCWFKADWCSPENWRQIVPMIQRIESAVDTIQSDDDG